MMLQIALVLLGTGLSLHPRSINPSGRQNSDGCHIVWLWLLHLPHPRSRFCVQLSIPNTAFPFYP